MSKQTKVSWIYNKLWSIKESVREDIRTVGDYLQFVTPVGFLIWVACYGTNLQARIFVGTYVVTTLIQITLKALFNNARPSEGENKEMEISTVGDTATGIEGVFSVKVLSCEFYDKLGKLCTFNDNYEVMFDKATNKFHIRYETDFILKDSNGNSLHYGDATAKIKINYVDTINQELKKDLSVGEGDSFPSGHTMSAMTGAMFWFEISPIVGLIGFVLGMVCALSRVIAKAHWFRDIFTSTFISILAYVLSGMFK